MTGTFTRSISKSIDGGRGGLPAVHRAASPHSMPCDPMPESYPHRLAFNGFIAVSQTPWSTRYLRQASCRRGHGPPVFGHGRTSGSGIFALCKIGNLEYVSTDALYEDTIVRAGLDLPIASADWRRVLDRECFSVNASGDHLHLESQSPAALLNDHGLIFWNYP